ncbi:MAG: response regulator transcription factor [Caldilineaceae bacterium]
MSEKIRIVLADDHPLIRTGIRTTLNIEDDFDVVGEATNSDEVRALCQKHKPDILLLDLNMPGASAVHTVRYLKENFPGLKILILTAYDDEAYIRGMTMLGIEGYLLKDEAPNTVIRAVRAVMEGHSWFSRTILDKLIHIQPSIYSTTEQLTTREQDLLTMLSRGLDNIGIAKELNLAEQTVRNYLSRLYSKLGIASRNEAIVWAIKNGFGKDKEIK